LYARISLARGSQSREARPASTTPHLAITTGPALHATADGLADHGIRRISHLPGIPRRPHPPRAIACALAPRNNHQPAPQHEVTTPNPGTQSPPKCGLVAAERRPKTSAGPRPLWLTKRAHTTLGFASSCANGKGATPTATATPPSRRPGYTNRLQYPYPPSS